MPQQISTPTSPQVEAFKKYGKYDINPATGTPSISIPLYEIKHRGYSIPLALKYAPLPLKPNYNYDVFGHGWSLSVSSAVSRSIEYVPDEMKNFKLDTSRFGDYYDNNNGTPCTSCLTEYNYAFDKFNVVLPDGSSFDFVLDNTFGDKVYVVSDNRYVKIVCNYDQYNIYSFTITDENGVVYKFEGADRVNEYNYSFSYKQSYVSWQLTEIKTPNSSEAIMFTYQKKMKSSYLDNLFYEDALTLQHYYDAWYEDGCYPNCFPKDIVEVDRVDVGVNYSYNMKLLTSITYGNRKVIFDYKNPNETEVRNYIDKIRILENGYQIKEIEWDTNIFDFNDNKDPVNKLYGLTINGKEPSSNPEVYQFNYNSISPTYGVDPWGYCNVKYRKQLPPFNMYTELSEYSEIFDLKYIGEVYVYENELGTHPYTRFNLSQQGPFNTTNMFMVGSPAIHGVLNKITYPTGGYTEFDFENHHFLTSTGYDGKYIQNPNQRVEALAGGFRIRTIKNYAKDGEVEDIKNYRYGESTNGLYSGLGKALVDPNLLTYMSLASYHSTTEVPSIINMVLGLNEDGTGTAQWNPYDAQGINTNHWNTWNLDWSYELTISASNFRKILNGRTPVLYPKVTVIYGPLDDIEKLNGKTVYEYNISDYNLLDYNNGNMYEEPLYYGNTLSYMPEKFRFPLLTTKEDYSFDKQLYNQGNGPDDYFKIDQRETYLWNVHYSGDVQDYVYKNPFPQDYYDSNSLIGPSFFESRYISMGGALMSTKFVDDFKRNMLISEYYAYTKGLLSSKIIDGSTGLIETSFEYPSDTNDPVVNKMIDKHMLSSILKETTTLNTNVIHSSKVQHQVFGSGSEEKILPAEYYEVKTAYTPNDVPEYKILSYTQQGHPKEIISTDGIYSIYLWGYNDRYLIGEIKIGEYSSTDYSAVETVVASVFQVQSIDALADKTFSENDEQSLLLQMKNFRGHNVLKESFVSTYTYNRFGKPTSITTPAGLITYYTYDSFGRLEFIKDAEENIINKNEYHYKGQ